MSSPVKGGGPAALPKRPPLGNTLRHAQPIKVASTCGVGLQTPTMASVHQRYRIIEKIDAGGMAEIYRGAAVSLDGFEKQVAIKRILPSICTDQKFVTMFLDEARLSMQLQHANIVQIFDIGKADGTYFVVMELIDGANLRRVMQRSFDRSKPVPVPLACYLISEVAKALAYAHERTDSNGQPLGIVHRDVSPPNVLLSRQGEVKLTDFGLAKAATHVQQTDAGVIKGKFSYLSPEIVDGRDADPRADVYSAGIILWELLCGRKLYAGKTDMETVELVRRSQVPPPSSIREDVDEELERIVLKSLARNPKRRYQSARALERAVVGHLFKHGMRVAESDVAVYLRELEDEGGEEADVIDVVQLLQVELTELRRSGRLDANLGQVPLQPSALRAQSNSRFSVDMVLERLDLLPLDDIADAESVDPILSLADRLDAPESPEISGEHDDGGGGGRLTLLAAAAVIVVVVGGLAILWQRGYLPF